MAADPEQSSEVLLQALTAVPAAVPESLQVTLEKFSEKISSIPEVDQRNFLERLHAAEFAQKLIRVVVASNFCADEIARCPSEFFSLCDSGSLEKASTQDEFDSRLEGRLRAVDAALDVKSLGLVLRQFRAAEMLRLIWRDQNRLCSMRELTSELSYLADVCIQCAANFHYQQLCEQWGTPLDANGDAMRMLVIGMGKLGAHELNLSSDIDLILAYKERGELEKDGRSLSHQEFFLALGQRLIKTLDERTGDGFVFRVDMRLRPYGDSGALVQSFAALEEYYQSQGRDWERYAMVKARVVDGEKASAELFMRMVQPFVYRRYIDFSVIDSLRSMKNMIVKEVRHRGLKGNIKIGAGGIREVEFIAQVFQLVHGGRDKNLQHQQLAQILPVLKERELLPADIVEQLAESYEFLRNIEHSLQALDDKQTQDLPVDEFERARLCWSMGFKDWDEFDKQLLVHTSRVRTIFAEVIADQSDAEEADGSSGGTPVGSMEESVGMLWAELDRGAVADGEHQDDDEFAQVLRAFKFSERMSLLQAVAQQRLDNVMPELIAQAMKCEIPVLALQRSLQVIDAVLRRSAYLVLLYENPIALGNLVQLCANSVYVTRKLVQHPLLLDELIDPRQLLHVQEPQEIQASLRQMLLRIEPGDTEAQMEQLRYFKRSHTLHLAAAEFNGMLPLMDISDSLTSVAEALLAAVLDLAWADMQSRYGALPGSTADEKHFMVLAYGKLGGMELGHGSDLDLVFIYEADPQQVSDGKVSLDSATYYTRLGQRMIHLLSTRTALGQVYDIDMRLRPSGNSGLLVSSAKGFQSYQESKAWTWEHQALVRARPVAGDKSLYPWFEQLRQSTLCQARNIERLRREVLEMRRKMSDHLLKDVTPQQFDLKHSPGGIVDIEFMVQYNVLMHAASEPRLCDNTGNIRIIEMLRDFGLLPSTQADTLCAAYIRYRACLHQRSLQDEDSVVENEMFGADIQAVKLVWQVLFEE